MFNHRQFKFALRSLKAAYSNLKNAVYADFEVGTKITAIVHLWDDLSTMFESSARTWDHNATHSNRRGVYVKTDHIANTSNNITDRHNHTEIVWLRVYLPLILTKMMKWRIYKLSISVFVGIKSPGDTKFGQDCSRQVCQKKLSSSLSDSEGQNAFEFFLLSNSK